MQIADMNVRPLRIEIP